MSRPVELELAVLGVELVLGQVDEAVILALLDEHLLAVARDLVGADLAEHGFLAVLQAEGAQRRLCCVAGSFFLVVAESSPTVLRR